MKAAITTNYTFNPVAGTIDLSSISNFSIKKLYSIVDLTANNMMIYAVGVPGLGYTNLTNGVLTLQANVSGLNAQDVLFILYDDPSAFNSALLDSTGDPITSNNPLPVEISNPVEIPGIANTIWVDDSVIPNVYYVRREKSLPDGSVTVEWKTASGAAATPVVADLKTALVNVPKLGSKGTDRSVNKPTLPNVGDDFGSTGVFANYILVKTIEVNLGRLSLTVENNSGSDIVLVRDDGTVAEGAPPANASVFTLAGGGSVGTQGGSWYTTTFLGRLQVFSPPTVPYPQISIYED